MGHDLCWLVATRGQVSHARVELAVQRYLGAAVYGAEVEARHPETEGYKNMIMIRVEERSQVLMQSLSRQGLQIGPS